MNKKLLALLLASNICYANNTSNIEYSKLHFNTNSVTIVDDKDFPESQEMKKELIIKNKKIAEKGYFETHGIDIYIDFLSTIKYRAPDQFKQYGMSENKSDSHLKQTPNQIKLAFNFKKLPIDDSKIIGYAPIGSYVKNPEGWNGIKVFFEDDSTNICAYEFTDLALSHGGVMAKKQGISYEVNKKISNVFVEGNPEKGFIYSAVWYNGIKVNRVDCLNKQYNKDLTNKVLQLAKRIDETFYSL